MIGPTYVLEYFLPYYRKVWDLVSSRGARVFEQDTDGNINPVFPALPDCGLISIYPMEPAAGMDIVKLRKIYGQRLAMRGGIVKHVIREDREAVRRELEYKLDPSLRSGGCVFSLDHRIPNGISIENYRYYFALPPLDPSRTGWCSHGDVINCTYTVINVWRYSQTRCSVHM